MVKQIKHPHKNKKELLDNICYLVTYVWIALSFLFLTFFLKGLGLNEIGDYLAGVTAPIAFFWFILSYRQTKEELEYTRKELELTRKEIKKGNVTSEEHESHIKRDVFFIEFEEFKTQMVSHLKRIGHSEIIDATDIYMCTSRVTGLLNRHYGSSKNNKNYYQHFLEQYLDNKSSQAIEGLFSFYYLYTIIAEKAYDIDEKLCFIVTNSRLGDLATDLKQRDEFRDAYKKWLKENKTYGSGLTPA